MKAKEMNSEEGSDVLAHSEDTERSDRTAITGSTKQRADISSKMPVWSFCLPVYFY